MCKLRFRLSLRYFLLKKQESSGKNYKNRTNLISVHIKELQLGEKVFQDLAYSNFKN
jgi:hypothetical protein